MAFVVAVIAGFVFLDGLARWLVIAAGLLVEVVEATAMLRYGRRRRSITGVEALPGRTGVALSACRPDGQVRLGGEIWAARSEEGCDPGDRVVVRAVDGLTLIVERPPAG